MLFSPGHSPRNLSTPEPVREQTPNLDHNPNRSSTSFSSGKSCKRGRNSPMVLEEDTYTEAMHMIIERDYFPSIQEDKDRYDLLQATRTGDRQCCLNGPVTPSYIRRGDKRQIKVYVDSFSLDKFLRKHTSEDNESFSRILDMVNQKMKEKYAFLLESGHNSLTGNGTSQSTLLDWKYKIKNLLMYHPADRGEVALTEEEKALRLKAQTKEINKANTRFHGKAKDADCTYMYLDKKVEKGYSYVRTPSPAPGVDESPLITWGEIEGTPLRLETDDTPSDIGRSSDGPQFKIPVLPLRDIKAHSLSREAARKLRERSKMFQKPPLPLSMRGGTGSARNASPAAQKFMRNKIAKSSSSIDESLRVSYRSASPGYSTPKRSRSMSRLGRDGSSGVRSPSVTVGSNTPC